MEVARYIETYKLFETKSADSIKGRAKEDQLGRVTDTLTTIRSINTTDVQTLLGTFGSLKNVFGANVEDFVLCSGLGEKKVKRLHDAIHQPFIANPSAFKKQKQIDSSLMAKPVDIKKSETKETKLEENNNNNYNNDVNNSTTTTTTTTATPNNVSIANSKATPMTIDLEETEPKTETKKSETNTFFSEKKKTEIETIETSTKKKKKTTTTTTSKASKQKAPKNSEIVNLEED